MNTTRIEWADFTWSPIVGCLNGCSYCYARRIATTRLAHLCPQCATFEPHLHVERLDQPQRVNRPALIFADSMADWWSPGVEQEWRGQAIFAMAAAPQHRFVVLTKRPDLITSLDRQDWPANAWLGVSITCGADWWRWETLAALPGHIHKLISMEPLLRIGAVDCLEMSTIYPDWLILGRQSGLNAQPVEERWQRAIRSACAAYGVPLFEKPGLPTQPPIRRMPQGLTAVFRKGGLA